MYMMCKCNNNSNDNNNNDDNNKFYVNHNKLC